MMSSSFAHPGRFVALCLLALLAMPAFAIAAHTPKEFRDLELRVSEHPHKAIEDARKWLAEAQKTKNRALELKSLRLQVLALEQIEDEAGLTEAAARGLALAVEMEHHEAEVEFLAARAGARVFAGKYAEASKEYDEALRLADGYGFDGHVARISIARGRVDLALGRIPEALEWTMKGHARFERLADRFGMSNEIGRASCRERV